MSSKTFKTAVAEFDQEVKKLDTRQVEIEGLLAERDQNQQHRTKLVEQRAEAVEANQTGLYGSYTEFQEHQKSKALTTKVEARREALQKQADEKKLAEEKALEEQNKKKFGELLTKVKRYYNHYVACHKYLDSTEDLLALDGCERLSLEKLEEMWKEMDGKMCVACIDHRDNLWDNSEEELDCPNDYCDYDDCCVHVKCLGDDLCCKTTGCMCEVDFFFNDKKDWWLDYSLDYNSVFQLGYLKVYH